VDRDPDERHARRHGSAKRRIWRKVHLAIDEGEEYQETVRESVSLTNMEVRAVEITGSGVGDAPILPGLLSQIPADEPIASDTADGACDGRACHDTIADRGAETITPPRRNAKLWKKESPGAGARNESLRAIKRFGRTLWRKWTG
jgi:hypothetical protein